MKLTTKLTIGELTPTGGRLYIGLTVEADEYLTDESGNILTKEATA